MEKLLTVVVPTYNTEIFLKDCLDSMLQSRLAERTEILVVDDGSKDGSGRMADEYAEKYPNVVQVVHKENGGHGSAINVGIALASGKYFRVVDSDDTLEPKAYEAYLMRLEKIDCDLIATPFICIRHVNGISVKVQKRQIEGAENLPKETILPFREAAEVLHVRMHEWTIRTRILKEQNIRISEHSFYVDMQYILFPVPWIETFCILPYAIYQYRLGEETQSVSVRNMQKNKEQHRTVLRSLIHFYKEREHCGDRKEILSYLATGIAKMEANQVQISLSLPIGKEAKQELIAIEQELKKECPAAYQRNKKKSLIWLRGSHYMMYPAAAAAWRIVKQKKKNITTKKTKKLTKRM